MLFSSPIFFVFFAVYFSLHLLVPVRWRLYLVIAGSTVFYAWWKIEYAWLLYALFAVGYLGAAWSASAKEPSRRKRRAMLSVCALFVPLLFFKYTNFLYDDVFGFITGGGHIVDL